ncbi:MAG: AMP-binding protein, partial [Bacteroidia bacterium]|nr:AMP-binding protein [Bacteroidia bacterium]
FSFDFSKGPLLRCALIRLSEEKYIFSFVIHHIISDGWSLNIMMKELFLFYSAFVQQKEIPFSPLRIQYKDYAVWQQQQLAEEKLSKQKSYWMEQFGGEVPVLNLPTEFTRPEIKTFKGEILQEIIDPHLASALKTLCQKNGCTLFMGLFSAVTALLHLRSRQTDLVIGTPVAGRNNAELENQVGVYLNTLPLRIKFSSSDSLNDLLQKAKNITLNAYKNQDYPFDHLIKDLNLLRDTGRNALFDVMVILQNTNITGGNLNERSFSGIKAKPHHYDHGGFSKTDLSFDFAETGQELQLKLEYSTDLFTRKTIMGVISDLKLILSAENHFVSFADLQVANTETPAGVEEHTPDLWLSYISSFRNRSLPFEKVPDEENTIYSLTKRVCVPIDALKKNPEVFASEINTTSEIIYAAIWIHLLQRTCNVQEITFGLSENKSAGAAHHKEFIPFITDISPELTVPAFLTELTKQFSTVGDFAVNDLKKLSDSIGRDTNSLFHTTLCITCGDEEKNRSGRFPLELVINKTLNEISLLYSSDLFSEEEIDYLQELYAAGLNKLLGCDEKTIVHELFSTFRPTKPDAIQKHSDTTDTTIIQLFKKEVTANPEAIALIYHESSFSYKELDLMSDHLAAMLQNTYSISAGNKVALDLQRNEWLPVSILGILKIGAVYVPLSSELPAKRKEFIIADSESKLILTDAEMQNISAHYSGKAASVSYATIDRTDIANIYYTSGTTGQPKGVKVTHGNLLNFFSNIKTDFRLKRGDRMIASTGLTFDISGFELLGTLCNGVQLIMAGDEEVADPHKLLAYIKNQKVNVFQLTPSRLQQLLNIEENFDFLSVLLIGGEALPQHLYEELKLLKNTDVINVYGPTETTIWSTLARLKESSELCIGHALNGEEIILINDK